MKVSDLIKKLQQIPPDCDVYGAANVDGFDEYNRFHIILCEEVVCENYERVAVIFNDVL